MLRFRHGDVDVPTGPEETPSTVMKTYMVLAVLILMAIFHWYFVATHDRFDVKAFSMYFILLSLLLIAIFHAVPPIRRVYPYNYFFMLVTAEFMILGAGDLGFDIGGVPLTIAVTIIIAIMEICLIIIGAILSEFLPLNSFLFVSSTYLSFMLATSMIFLNFMVHVRVTLIIMRLMLLYTVIAMCIYQSMWVHSRDCSDEHANDEYLLMGLLLFLDFVVFFVLSPFYIMQPPEFTEVNKCFCECLPYDRQM
ncbi:uncharacterized protein LOC108607493 [Drosophila busckii]|uniref:uncharacterized protein LOC108607493 n=1 Tax=Drosophila busckii TaxID=30019 RepID=UPI00083EE5CE|nr:uncharacterized protein LOC108607493 [Drosophila busckii]